MNPTESGDTRRILWARALRAFGDGYVAILLPVHLSALGSVRSRWARSSTATLLGSALLTLALGAAGHRVRRRPALLAASLVMAATGLAFAAAEGFWPLLLIAFGWPLVIAGALKIAYDPMLLRAFAKIRPPEEAGRAEARPRRPQREVGRDIGRDTGAVLLQMDDTHPDEPKAQKPG